MVLQLKGSRCVSELLRHIWSCTVDPGTGSVVHAFTTGTTVQVFLLDGRLKGDTHVQNEAAALAATTEVLNERIGDEGTSR